MPAQGRAIGRTQNGRFVAQLLVDLSPCSGGLQMHNCQKISCRYLLVEGKVRSPSLTTQILSKKLTKRRCSSHLGFFPLLCLVISCYSEAPNVHTGSENGSTGLKCSKYCKHLRGPSQCTFTALPGLHFSQQEGSSASSQQVSRP